MQTDSCASSDAIDAAFRGRPLFLVPHLDRQIHGPDDDAFSYRAMSKKRPAAPVAGAFAPWPPSPLFASVLHYDYPFPG